MSEHSNNNNGALNSLKAGEIYKEGFYILKFGHFSKELALGANFSWFDSFTFFTLDKRLNRDPLFFESKYFLELGDIEVAYQDNLSNDENILKWKCLITGCEANSRSGDSFFKDELHKDWLALLNKIEV